MAGGGGVYWFARTEEHSFEVDKRFDCKGTETGATEKGLV